MFFNRVTAQGSAMTYVKFHGSHAARPKFVHAPLSLGIVMPGGNNGLTGAYRTGRSARKLQWHKLAPIMRAASLPSDSSDSFHGRCVNARAPLPWRLPWNSLACNVWILIASHKIRRKSWLAIRIQMFKNCWKNFFPVLIIEVEISCGRREKLWCLRKNVACN